MEHWIVTVTQTSEMGEDSTKLVGIASDRESAEEAVRKQAEILLRSPFIDYEGESIPPSRHSKVLWIFLGTEGYGELTVTAQKVKVNEFGFESHDEIIRKGGGEY
jgi:hypothetical protein